MHADIIGGQQQCMQTWPHLQGVAVDVLVEQFRDEALGPLPTFRLVQVLHEVLLQFVPIHEGFAGPRPETTLLGVSTDHLLQKLSDPLRISLQPATQLFGQRVSVRGGALPELFQESRKGIFDQWGQRGSFR